VGDLPGPATDCAAGLFSAYITLEHNAGYYRTLSAHRLLSIRRPEKLVHGSSDHHDNSLGHFSFDRCAVLVRYIRDFGCGPNKCNTNFLRLASNPT
jgi:hypothetical protein